MKKHLDKVLIIAGFLSSATMAMAQNTPGGCAIAGPSNAPLTIEEYADFDCHFCARGSNTMKQVLKDYPGQIKLIYRNMPLPTHQNAEIAAKAFSAVCLQGSNLADAFQSDLFTNQDEYKKQGEPYLYEVANKIGVNVEQMKIDMGGAEVATSLEDDRQAAKLHSFSGTPSFLIGSETVTGALPYTDIKKVIERQLHH